MKPVLIEAQYLPPIASFAALRSSSEIILERHEHYIKQSYRNRACIKAAHGRDDLIIPLTAKHGKVMITDVRIDYTQKWLNNHWRTVRSAYNNAPFYEYYADDLEKVLFRRFTFLYELNVHLLSMCLRWLTWSVPVKESLSYEKTPAPSVIDLRSRIHPKKTDHLQDFFTPTPYTQVFGSTFEANLSLIDLVFCVGPSAAKIVTDSIPGK